MRSETSENTTMQQATLLFVLNFLDAGLTLFWTTTGRASEANQFMQYLLDGGPAPFLIFKICMGLLAALCFYRWAHLPFARFGLRLSLVVYFIICGIHLGVGAVTTGATHWLGL